jgi:Na+/H+-dicarboxylate symporter
MKLWVKILIGFALGAVVGLIVGPSIAVVKPLGDLCTRQALVGERPRHNWCS